jgi:hypothetical protein
MAKKAEREPEETPERKAFLLRLSPELFEELRAWAAQDLRSLNGHVEFLLREAIRRRKEGDATRRRS